MITVIGRVLPGSGRSGCSFFHFSLTQNLSFCEIYLLYMSSLYVFFVIMIYVCVCKLDASHNPKKGGAICMGMTQKNKYMSIYNTMYTVKWRLYM